MCSRHDDDPRKDVQQRMEENARRHIAAAEPGAHIEFTGAGRPPLLMPLPPAAPRGPMKLHDLEQVQSLAELRRDINSILMAPQIYEFKVVAHLHSRERAPEDLVGMLGKDWPSVAIITRLRERLAETEDRLRELGVEVE